MFFLFYLSSLIIYTSAISSSPSLEKLFVNTIKRWNINIQSPSDRRERWNRFTDFKARVDTLTPGHNLQALNSFSVTNDAEYALLRLEEALRNETFYSSSMYTESNNRPEKKRRKRALAATNTYWYDLGLPTPTDQKSCGACWSFPTVGAIEGVYKKTTGQEISLSQQYLVDCTFEYSGCSGGDSSDGYKILRDRQYLPLLSSYPYKGYWTEKCLSASKISTFQDNGMTKMWFQNYYKLPATESGYLGGLTDSPVPFGMYISNNFLGYSGGVVEDSNCASDHKGHAMLLVGYTSNEITIKASYGTGWGEKGYARYKRGSSYLSQCDMYKTAYIIELTVRRDIEYKAVIGTTADMKTFAKSRKDCKAMNTGSVTGWDLAIIPTAYHNEQVVRALLAVSPNVEGTATDAKNFAWIGLRDMDLDKIYLWVDNSAVDYYNNTLKNTLKFGMINKNTGKWSTIGSTNYLTYSVCSRYTTCWDISTAIGNGTVSFSKSTRVESTVASITCNTGATISGSASLTCAGGNWGTLPTCTYGSDVTVCPAVTVASATISPVQPVVSGVKITITCASGYTINGDAVLTCSGTSFDKSAPKCEKDAFTGCNSKPSVINGTASGTPPYAPGDKVTVTCLPKNKLKGDDVLTCKDGAWSPDAPTCSYSRADKALVTSPLLVLLILLSYCYY